MIADCVIVIRTKAGDDLLAILNGEINGVVKTEHPYYIRFNRESNNIAMIPYCSLSDEKYFEFHRNDLLFLVTANQVISENFMRMVSNHNTVASLQGDEAEAAETTLPINYISGNVTKH